MDLWPPERVTHLWWPWRTNIDQLLPYILLVIATAVSLSRPHTWPGLPVTLTLLAATVLWLTLTVTWPPKRLRDNGFAIAVSYVGTLVLATLLITREPLFLIFMISGFFQALRLRPLPVAVAGIFATSFLINTMPAGGPAIALTQEPALWIPIIVVQTAAVSVGTLISAKISKQNSQLRQTNDELEAAQEENAGLHRQLLSQAREAGVLDERQRLSEEIHDTLAQGFTGIITQLEAARQARDNAAEWQRHLDNATALARENLAEARRTVHALRPQQLNEATLPEALDQVSAQWSERASVPVQFTTTGTARPLHPEIEATLLRITQEALTNVAKHANAGRVGVTLSYMEDQVTLDVRDDGVGFAEVTWGYGLTGMRQRAQRLSGTLDIESEPGGGTAVSATVPAISGAS
ncbi:Signal transduction histidine kinase [Amycolatopsis xylanica]|uniref:Signal transduction histidine kinase n=1 Tax=Amycolatopsis xylanica TaxID=589385 RepID=A0A1H3S1N0_9PSEU|nr:sensor histidine kinase [Amycolatopsis xylanica]SDZ31455.1 Signal transduction histidine kinase [Amycolatopsis xylanica]